MLFYVSACDFHVNRQLCVYVGHAPYSHSISSGDRADIVKSAKGVVGLALIYFMLILVISPLELRMYYLINIVFFYGAPSWHLEGTMIQSVCVD